MRARWWTLAMLLVALGIALGPRGTAHAEPLTVVVAEDGNGPAKMLRDANGNIVIFGYTYYGTTMMLNRITCHDPQCVTPTTVEPIWDLSQGPDLSGIPDIFLHNDNPIIVYTYDFHIEMRVCWDRICNSATTHTLIELPTHYDWMTYALTMNSQDFLVLAYSLHAINYPYPSPPITEILFCGDIICNTRITSSISPNNIVLSDMELNSNDIPYFTFVAYENGPRPFILHRCGNTTCSADNLNTTLEITDTFSTGIQSYITFDTNNNPFIGYSRKFSNNDIEAYGLRTVSCGNSTCTANNVYTDVDIPLDNDQYGPLAIDIELNSLGYPQIGYLLTGGHHKLASCTNTTCSSFVMTYIQFTGPLFDRSDLILADDVPLYAYYDGRYLPGDLKLYIANATRPPQLNVRGNGVAIAHADTTPDPADHTRFPNTTQGTPLTHTFTLQNQGSVPLDITAISVPTGFTLTSASAMTIAGFASSTLAVQCDAAAPWRYRGTISIASNDSTTPIRTFEVACDVSQVTVRGNGADIAHTDATPDAADHTQFATTVANEPTTRTFTVQNLGTEPLLFSAVIAPAGFSIVSASTGTIAPLASAAFGVRCDARSAGQYQGVVQVLNNDYWQNPYTFAVACVVNPTDEPEITVLGNGQVIEQGAAYPLHSNHTLFGSQVVSSIIARTFTISNSGGSALNFGMITVSSGFMISTLPQNILPGQSTTFSLYCNVGMPPGQYTGWVQIINNDRDESIYRFAVRCQFTATPQPEINVFGNGNPIDSAPTEPTQWNHTDFPNVAAGTPSTRTFTILNNSHDEPELRLGAVQVPTGFTLTQAPHTILAPQASTSFTVRCDAMANGLAVGDVVIPNNDTNENPYRFRISCQTGIILLAVRGNGLPINDGASLPNSGDQTDFGQTSVGLPLARVFVIENRAAAPLNLGALALPNGFSLSVPPSTTVAAGDSTPLVVQCDATTIGEYRGTLRIPHDNGEHQFDVRCAVEAQAGAAVSTLRAAAVGVSAPFARTGGEVLWTYSITNTSDLPLRGVRAVIRYPDADMQILRANSTDGTRGDVRTAGDGVAVTYTLDLAAGQTVTLTINTRLPQRAAIYTSALNARADGVGASNSVSLQVTAARTLPLTGEPPGWSIALRTALALTVGLALARVRGR
jgi:hypothetical protein